MPTMNHQMSDQVDGRGPRFAAWVTTNVLVAVLLVSAVSPRGAAVLLAAQAVVPPVTERESAAPLRFAQLVGLVGVVGFAAGLPLLGLIATGTALAAAFLNAAFGIYLGCQLYPLVARITQTRSNRKEFVHGTF